MKVNLFPPSIRNKASKFTLAKRPISKSRKSPSKNLSNSLNKNNDPSYISNFAKFQYQKHLSFSKPQSLNKGKIPIRTSQNPPKLNKTKKDSLLSNNDFMQFFKQLQLLKKQNIHTNRTICCNSSLDKKKDYITSCYPSMRKKSSKPHSTTAKEKAIKVNTLLTFNTTTCQVPQSSSKKKESSSLNAKEKKITNKKFFKEFKPFHILFNKPISNQRAFTSNLTIKNAAIMTYQVNSKKVLSPKARSNKTQEMRKKEYNTNTNINSYLNKVINTTSDNNKKNNFNININSDNDNDNCNNLYVHCFNGNDRINYSFNEDEKGEYIQKNDDINIYKTNNVDDYSDEDDENSGLLAYDEVKDIIVYYNMDEIVKKDYYLFDRNEEENFNKVRRNYYLKFFGLKEGNNSYSSNNTRENNMKGLLNLMSNSRKKKENKSPSTNASSKNKTAYVTVIKNQS